MTTGLFINDEHFRYITWVGSPKEIKQIHMFVKNNQAMTRIDFKETLDVIRDFLTQQGVNFGILMMADGTYVLTEKKVRMDALLVKLATGINYHGVVKDASADLVLLTKHLGDRT